VRKVMPSFCCRSLSGLPIEVYGDGAQIMDMIYVTDVANILVNALIATDLMGSIRDTLEAGTGRRTTVNQIAELVVKEARTLVDDVPDVAHLPMRPGEDEGSVVLGNPTTLAVLDIKPADLVPLEEGIRRTVAYFHNYLDL